MLGVQLRMARAALGLGVRDVAERSGVSAFTIVRIEAGEQVKDSTLNKVQVALEAAGVIFVPENGEGPGVRLRKPKT
ncbi:helix-turn-helix transcriptional regulator [Xanthobacter sp. V0B-10]|uniref:helix-turn-helix domain-containing protein n=1 Tax=Xanthobacter albus TaxID=3119929 RepID=UPI003729F821